MNTPVRRVRLTDNLINETRQALSLPADTDITVIIRTAMIRVSGSEENPVIPSGPKKKG